MLDLREHPEQLKVDQTCAWRFRIDVFSLRCAFREEQMQSGSKASHAPSERHKMTVQRLPLNRLSLLLTIGFHLLLALLWIWTQQQHPSSPAQPEIVSLLLQPAARLSSTPTQPQNRAVQKFVRPRPPIPRTTQSRTSKAPLPLPFSEQSAVTEVDTSPGVKEAEQVDSDTAVTATQSGTKFDIEFARRQAGRIARETGAGESRALIEANTPGMRLRRGFEAAHVQPLTRVEQDSYTASDGTIIYRKRVRNRTYCRRSGNVGGGGLSGISVNEGAGWVSCPSQAEWKR